MKTRLLLISSVLILVFGISSCATAKTKNANMSGTERAEAASLTMELVENDIRLLIIQIGTTNSALQALIQSNQTDVEKAYKEYVATFDVTKETAERFFTHSDKQNLQTRAYFDGWRSEGQAYVNSDVQALSEQRRADLNSYNADIAESSVGVRGELNKYISTTNEIKTYFATDLTTKGVAAIVPVSEAAIQSGYALNTMLSSLYVSIASFRTELASSAGL